LGYADWEAVLFFSGFQLPQGVKESFYNYLRSLVSLSVLEHLINEENP